MTLTPDAEAVLLELFRLSREAPYDDRLGLPCRDIAMHRCGSAQPVEELNRAALVQYITPEGSRGPVSLKGQVLAASIQVRARALAMVDQAADVGNSVLTAQPRYLGPAATRGSLTKAVVVFAVTWIVAYLWNFLGFAPLFFIPLAAATVLTSFWVVHRAARVDGLSWKQSLTLTASGLGGGAVGLVPFAVILWLGRRELANPYLPFLQTVLILAIPLLVGVTLGTYLGSWLGCRIVGWKEESADAP